MEYIIKIAPDQEAAVPLLAEGWIGAWNKIGGDVTLGSHDHIYPWTLVDTTEVLEAAGPLISQLIKTPGLPRAVRIVLTNRRRKASERTDA